MLCVFHFFDDWFVTLVITHSISVLFLLLLSFFLWYFHYTFILKTTHRVGRASMKSIANNPEFFDGLICLLFLFTFQFFSSSSSFSLSLTVHSNFYPKPKFDPMIFYVVGCMWCLLNSFQITFKLFNYIIGILCIEYKVYCAMEMERNTKQQLQYEAWA